jgi:hypothetical protein
MSYMISFKSFSYNCSFEIIIGIILLSLTVYISKLYELFVSVLKTLDPVMLLSIHSSLNFKTKNIRGFFLYDVISLYHFIPILFVDNNIFLIIQYLSFL